MEERRTIYRWQDVADPTEWTFEDEHGHELFRRGRANRLRRWRRRAISKCPWPPLRMRSGWRRSMRGVGADRCMPSNLYEPDRAMVAIRVR
jgi:hypothetical protein